MVAIRGLLSFGIVALVAFAVAVWLAAESRAQTADNPSSIAGSWTLNKDLSNQQLGGRRNDRDEAQGGRRGGFGRGGGFGGGRGGFGGGGFGRGSGGFDREEMARRREALRDIMNPPDHLVITDTGSMVVLTGPDGRTTRLSPDGKKIKDESTKIERKTKWDGAKLVSEISGIGEQKFVETYSVDVEHRQLHVAVQMSGSRAGQERTINRVYDADAR